MATDRIPLSSPIEIAPRPRALLAAGASVLGHVRAWLARRRQRRTLAALEDRLLADIGVSPADARVESRRLL
jgi:uncharacterized protein YjiS (DUF1127 family)